jgi:hypothetical protein
MVICMTLRGAVLAAQRKRLFSLVSTVLRILFRHTRGCQVFTGLVAFRHSPL